MRLDDARSPSTVLTPVTGGPGADANSAARNTSGFGFKLAWNDAQTANSLYKVQPGDNLIGIVQQHAQSQGVSLTDSQALRWAQNLAAQNGMPNANRIHPGQQLNLQGLTAQWQSAGKDLPPPMNPAAASRKAGPNTIANATTNANAATPPLTTAAVLSAKAASPSAANGMARPAPNFSTALPNRASNATIPRGMPQSNAAAPTTTATPAGADSLNTPHPVLDKTLDRAVSKGFIPANEKQDVYQKVLQMANKHGFAPDDFARMTLMESDGMNPKATNDRCHGIIQFCDGPARGAAAVGMANNPKSILGLSVYQQLHLTDTYFQKAGLNKQQGKVPLDDLYLSVLQPAARSETRPDAPLGIPGAQAGALYTDKNSNNNTITRQSLIRGLMQNAQRVLGLDRADVKRPDNRAQTPATPPTQASPESPSSTSSRRSSQRVASYDGNDATPTQMR